MFWKKKKMPFPEDQMHTLTQHAFVAATAEQVADVLRTLDELSRDDGADYRISSSCEKAISDAKDFQKQCGDFDEVLQSKFDTRELTYIRFRTVVDHAKEVFDRNLDKLPIVIKSAIRTDGARERKLVETLVKENESMLKATAELTAELSLIDTTGSSAKAETTLERIEELRRRAHLYAAN